MIFYTIIKIKNNNVKSYQISFDPKSYILK